MTTLLSLIRFKTRTEDGMKTINIRKFPEELHKLAKASAAKEGKSLQDWFIEAVREKIEREEKQEK